MSAEAQERTYGGWRQPPSPGVGPLRLIPTVGLFIGLAVTVLVSMRWGIVPAAVFVLIALVGAAPAVFRRRGRSLYSHWTRKRKWRAHVRKGRHHYRSGLAGVTLSGARNLPGLLAKVRVWEAVDAFGREYGLIEIPSIRQWAVVMRVQAQGGALVDQETTDVWVAGWGEYLASLGQEGGIVQAVAVVETIPDAGARLAAHVAGLIEPDAPEFARQVMAASAVELPRGVADTVGYVAITFSERKLDIIRKSTKDLEAAEAVALDIGRRLPDLCVDLKDVGASRGVPMTADDLARRAREAYDPASALVHAQLEADGLPVAVSWEDAGPSVHVAAAESYRHDSGLSVTWEALKVPPGVVRDSIMQRLVGPLAEVPRKRVALIYRPVDAGDTAALVDRDYKAAINRAGRRKGPVHAHDSADLRAAEQATREEASGAGVTTLSVLVTATVDVDEPDQLSKARQAVERAARGSRFRLAPVFGAQDAAFAAALGVGLSLPDLSVIPSAVREHL